MSRRRLALLLLAALAASPALADPAVPEPSGYRLDEYRAPVPDTLAGATVLHAKELQALIAEARPTLIDVLPAQRRPAGMKAGMPWLPPARHDIEGSLWIPDIGRGALSLEMDAWFRARLDSITAGDRAHPLVFYCNADCWMSWNAAKRAVGYGYTRVIWYPDGPEGWAAAGGKLAVATPESPPG